MTNPVTARPIDPTLWFDHEAEAAATLYVSLFPNSRITNRMRTPTETPSGNAPGDVLTVSFELDGQPFTGLNGGPMFRFNPAVSVFVNAESTAEVDRLFAALSEGGSVLMPLDTYPFSERFGWVADRFGLSWQINLGPQPQKIAIALMFTGRALGKAEEAMRLYTSLLANSGIDYVERYAEGEAGGAPGTVKVAQFHLNGRAFAAMDSAVEHGFTFSEAISLMIPCETQADLDTLWAVLSADPDAEQCGWCKDAYGVSWQIVPAEMLDMLSSSDTEATRRVMDAFMPMKKLELEPLRRAFRGD